MIRLPAAALSFVAVLAFGCSESPPGDNVDQALQQDGGLGEGQVGDLGSVGLFGTVKDPLGQPVAGAEIKAGGESAFSETDGTFSLALAPGEVQLTILRTWFKPYSETVTILEGRSTNKTFSIEEYPLKIDPDDRALAESYNFDWTKDTVSIAIVEPSTQKNFDNAIYFRNPALYRDTSGEEKVTPAKLPTISGTTASNFSFALTSGDHSGEQAIEQIVDKLSDTPLAGGERDDFLIYAPTRNWLINWDLDKAKGFNAAGVAVRQQNWGSDAVRPQGLEKVYVYQSEIWVQVVFESFVVLGSGISDSDGDGRKEVWGKLNPRLYTAELVTALKQEYIGKIFDSRALREAMDESLNELYSTTSPEVLQAIAQSFEIPNVGTIKYPFVVLVHSGGEQNVILVGPGK